MDYFNGFRQLMDCCPKMGRFYILQFEGDTTEWQNDTSYRRGSGHVGFITIGGFSDRKTALERTVTAKVFVYDGLEARWYPVRRNTKGIYFNYCGSTYYLSKEPIPKEMR
jgi:hypothetical protein